MLLVSFFEIEICSFGEVCSSLGNASRFSWDWLMVVVEWWFFADRDVPDEELVAGLLLGCFWVVSGFWSLGCFCLLGGFCLLGCFLLLAGFWLVASGLFFFFLIDIEFSSLLSLSSTTYLQYACM